MPFDNDANLQQKISTYQEVARENPNVDVSMLMMNALENQKLNMVSAKAKHWAYLVSISVPPLGLLWAANYYFSDKDDGKQVAYTCVLLTIIALLLFWGSYKAFFGSASSTLNQVQKITPSQVMQLTQ